MFFASYQSGWFNHTTKWEKENLPMKFYFSDQENLEFYYR